MTRSDPLGRKLVQHLVHTPAPNRSVGQDAAQMHGRAGVRRLSRGSKYPGRIDDRKRESVGDEYLDSIEAGEVKRLLVNTLSGLKKPEGR